MTIDERRMCIAYADMISIRDLMQHILKVNAYSLLSSDGRTHFANAEIALDRVGEEFEEMLCRRTDYGSDIPQYANGTKGEAKDEE